MTHFERKALETLGERLRVFRHTKNLSQEKFAELAGLDRTYVSGLERGKRNPSFLMLIRLSESLGVKPSKLFGEEK